MQPILSSIQLFNFMFLISVYQTAPIQTYRPIVSQVQTAPIQTYRPVATPVQTAPIQTYRPQAQAPAVTVSITTGQTSQTVYRPQAIQQQQFPAAANFNQRSGYSYRTPSL